MLVCSNVECETVMNAIRTRLNVSTTMRLFANSLQPRPETLLSAFVECNFSGYAQVALNGTWGIVTKSSDGIYQTRAARVSFTHSGGAVQNNVFGYFLIAAGALIAAERFTLPVLMQAASPVLAIQVTYKDKAGISI